MLKYLLPMVALTLPFYASPADPITNELVDVFTQAAQACDTTYTGFAGMLLKSTCKKTCNKAADRTRAHANYQQGKKQIKKDVNSCVMTLDFSKKNKPPILVKLKQYKAGIKAGSWPASSALANNPRQQSMPAKQAKLKQDQQVVQPETAVGPSAISEQARWIEENRPMPTPKKISVGNDVSAYPLPQPPFKHDQQEMFSVVLHATAMANKHLIVSKNATTPRKCTTLINANRPITIYNVRGCTNTLQLIAKHTTKKQLFIDLHDFTVNYQKAEAAKRPKKVILPTGSKAMFTVSELKLFRDYIQAIDAKDLESCPGTNTGGLSDDLSNPENKKRFAAVVQALANCSKTLQQKDNQNYRRFAKAMKSYHRGFAKAAR
jgi:hypothetical protein